MNILIVGGTAREHAIGRALHRSKTMPKIFCCGTSLNPGIKQISHQYWLGDICDVKTIVDLAKKWQIDLAIIGPEAPLEKGLVDALWNATIPTIGPKKKLARIETSKQFARDLMKKHKISGLPKYASFKNMKGIRDYLSELGKDNYVIKADGLMAGKGVKVAGDHLQSFDEALQYCQEIFDAGYSIVIEEKFIGQEFSLMCFCDGKHLVPMPIVQDHKRAFVDDKGPNTGGMGSYTDANHRLPFLTEKDVKKALSINKKVMTALMQDTEEKYIGIFYGSFIATKDGVKVIEFNARFGDPEALNVLTILQSDFVEILEAMLLGNLRTSDVKFAEVATVCKYAVPKGYPEAKSNELKKACIDIAAVKNKANLYFASVNVADGKIYATSSRTAAYVGVADSISIAEEIAEREIRAIDGPLFHREDIGTDKLIQKRIDSMRKLRKS